MANRNSPTVWPQIKINFPQAPYWTDGCGGWKVLILI